MNIFTYGSLMFERVWSRVVVCVYERLNVTMCGYKRRKLKERTYPAVIPGTRSDSIDGVLYLKVQPEDLLRLDRFEGNYYQKEKAECRIPGGKITGAWVYVLKDRYSDLLEDAPWDPAWFAETEIRSFLKSYEGFGLDREK